MATGLLAVVLSAWLDMSGAQTAAKPTPVEQAIAAKDWPRALDLLDGNLQARPGDAQSWSLRGRVLDQLSRGDEALRAYRRAAQLAPQSPQAASELCWALIKSGQGATQARAACEKSVALERDYASTVNLGHTYLLSGQENEAYRWYRESVTLVQSEQTMGEGPLADFDLFIAKGWHVEASQAARRWFGDSFHTLARAQRLVRQGAALDQAERFNEALPLLYEAATLTEQVLGPDHVDVGRRLNDLALIHHNLGSHEQALPLFKRALAIVENSLGPEHPAISAVLNNLAAHYEAIAHYERALPLYQRALAIAEKNLGAEHQATGSLVSNLALLHERMGGYEQALPLHQRALAIAEKADGPEHPNTGVRLNNVAVLYRALGRYELALPLFQRALAILEKTAGPEHSTTGLALGNQADMYLAMGRYELALPLLLRSLTIAEKTLGPDHARTGWSLSNLAGLYRSIGRYEQALPLYLRALAIAEKAEGREHPSTGVRLNNLAMLYRSMGRYEQALPLYQRALAIAEKVEGPEHPSTGARVNNLAFLYWLMGRHEPALPLFQRALAIAEKAEGAEHPSTGVILNNLATLYQQLGRSEEALPLWQRAERIAVASQSPELLWAVQGLMSEAHARRGEPDVAAYWGKQSVNTIQALRGNVSKLDRELQQSFLENKRLVYTRLSDLLIRQGRIPEAQQVMALLKEEEYFDFVRRDASIKPGSPELSLTGAERRVHEQFYAVREQLARLAQEANAIRERQRRGGASAADEQRLNELQPQLAAARKAFDDFMAGLGRLLAASRPADARSVRETSSALGTTLGALREAGRSVAAVQYVASEQRLHIIVTTQRLQWAREVALPEAELNARIAKFRDAVQNPRLDPEALGRALYAQLIEPVERELAEQRIDTLLLVLDGSLRYLPFAALQDAQGRYLIERQRLVLHTPAAQAVLGQAPQPRWHVAALGVTRGFPEQNFAPLPAVRGEIDAIVQPQVLPGHAFLDERFTRTQLERSLASPVLHIASHFRFVPGSDASFLLLGDGSRLSLGQVRTELPRLDEVDLLTLSACDTATGGGRRENGLEVEGLGVLAQQQGAKAVLATLWAVADASTGRLMQDFYRNRQVSAMNKAEALRQAQLSMLRGGGTAATADAARGAARSVAPQAGSTNVAFSPRPNAPHAHPFFWAPFILMGNWL